MAQRQGASRHRAPDPLVPKVARLAKAGEPTLLKLVRNRRQLLIGAGAAVVATGAVGSAAAVMGGGGISAALGDSATSTRSPRDAGAFADRDASYTQSLGDSIDLGAAGLMDTAGAAAAAAAKATPTNPNLLSRDPILHLLRRATFGPTRVLVDAAGKTGIDEWLEQQLNPGKVDDPVATKAMTAFPTVSMSTAQIRRTVKDGDFQAQFELGQATIARQMWSSRQLFEVMVDFWSNHLNVTNPFDGGWDVRTSYDNDVIRKHALGKFSDMLKASARHPAMLRYLDNAASDRRSVNENYGRELLELHTVGIDGGYNEKDVRNSAYIMTGRTVTDDGQFRYAADRHWVDSVKVLGFKDKNPSRSKGLDVGEKYLKYLATHPSTAKNIARKLAVRFVCDAPPNGLVQRLADTYLENGTAIAPVLRVLFRSQEFWIATGMKTRRPLENFVATARALGVAPGSDTRAGVEGLYFMTQRFGNAPMAWVPPNGYPDVAAAWRSAHATLSLWNAHRALIGGYERGLSYPKVEGLVGKRPGTTGPYVDSLADRLVFQKVSAAHRKALLTFLSAKDGTAVKNSSLGGKVEHLAPLLLDSIYHALR
ncbi:hypothetical protein Ais01nite_24730 [Asanoa ishikariensis]|uniref:Uncharacterized conserved protein, DUF1800 family n=1 Tax=Asanoa ishikariensis TaxID=137265 RepID=A0A1H3R5A1_9ACTN|nr:DUF1800 domain-containing protein [Asanoa ishikariensis]GIF64438.1 hypothetical protein Ais01nite_24730 [Asanoa ishikariensis]SDZ20398.1 Uncharacterized conserved protein, DUF1800 family [Asanoa ishikariensis]